MTRYHSQLVDCANMSTMKNEYMVVGDAVEITLHRFGLPHLCYVDLADLPKLMTRRVTWVPNPARNSTTKFYAQCKLGTNKTVLMHRFIMDAPIGSEVHHIDNDGLNNRRSSNLKFLTHQGNLRERWPGRDWSGLELKRSLAAEYREERDIASRVQSENGITRQQMWKVRMAPTSSRVSLAYLDAIEAAGIRTLAQMQAASPRSGKWGAVKGD